MPKFIVVHIFLLDISIWGQIGKFHFVPKVFSWLVMLVNQRQEGVSGNSILMYFRKRMKIYRFMLEHMTDEQKFNLTAKLANDVSSIHILFISHHNFFPS